MAQAQNANDEKCERTRSESPGSPTNLHNTLLQYDKNNDGFLNWDEFSEMCRDRNITEDQRDQYAMDLLPHANNDDWKISIEQIALRNKSIIKMKRSKTAKSDIVIPSTLLMVEPLGLFERYDLERDGTLTKTQFVQMVNDLYPKQEQMDINIEMLHYRDNVHDLEVELRRFGGENPNKLDFLKLCVEVFDKTDEFEIQIQNEGNEADEIQYVRNTINHFTDNIKNGRKGLYAKAKQTIEVLSLWFDEHGIPNYRENKELRTENEELIEEKSSWEKELQRKSKEGECRDQFEKELEETNKQIQSDYDALQYRYHDLDERHTQLTTEHHEKERELNKTQKDLKNTKEMNEKLKKHIPENIELQNQCTSLLKQLELVRKTHETHVNRLEKENEELQNNEFSLMPSATTHGIAATAPDTDEDEFQSESDDSSMMRQRRYSDDSIARIHSVFPQSRIHSISGSEQPICDIYAYHHDSNYYETDQDEQRVCHDEHRENEEIQSIIHKLSQSQQQIDSKLNDIVEYNKGDIAHTLKNELNQSLTEISYHVKQKESQQREALNRIRNSVQQTLVSVRNEMDSMKYKYTQYKQNEDILDYLKHNVVHKDDLRNIQQSLCVKAKISSEAIESAQDLIQNAQMEAEANHATQFSALRQNIYTMKQQLNELSDIIPQQQKQIYDEDISLLDNIYSIQNQLNDISRKIKSYDDDDDDISVESQSSNVSNKYRTFKQQMVDEYDELKQIQLLEEEHKEEKEYNVELIENNEFMKHQNVVSNYEELLLAHMSPSIKDSELIDLISIKIKQEMETMMAENRTLIGLDLSQNMRFTNHEILTKLAESNAKLLQILNDRSDAAIGLYVKNMDKETKEKTHREREIAQKCWLQQIERQTEQYKGYNRDEFNKLYGVIDAIKDDIRNHCDKDRYHENNNEGSSSEGVIDLIETRIVENVDRSMKENQTSYWKYGGCTLFTALAANFLCIILFFIHKGYHAP